MPTAKLGRYAPTGKLGLCYIKFVTAYPDKIKSKTLNREQISVERTFFENPQKPFCKKVFCGAFFQKSDLNPQPKLTTNPPSLFILAQKAQKKKLCKKKTPFLWGVAPNPIRFLKKAKPKTFKLGRYAPTGKLELCYIKFVTAYPDKIKSKTLNREQISVERTFF